MTLTEIRTVLRNLRNSNAQSFLVSFSFIDFDVQKMTGKT